MFPEALHAFVPKSEASTEDDVGIEDASPESIRKALDKVRILYQEVPMNFIWKIFGIPALRVRKMPRGKEHLLGLYLASDMGMPSSFAQAESFWDYTKGVGIRVGGVREKV